MTRAFSQAANMVGASWYLKAWRKHRGMSQEALAAAADTSKGYISDLEGGKRPLPPGAMMDRLATALGVDARQLLAEDPEHVATGRRTVPLVGYVGAGAIAHFYASADEGLDEVEAPPNATQQTRAAEIRGESLGPLFDRWLVFYDDVRSPVTPDLIGQLCVVGLPDERVLVKKLQLSREPGLFHLISNAEAPMLDQEVAWAARVKDMRPR